MFMCVQYLKQIGMAHNTELKAVKDMVQQLLMRGKVRIGLDDVRVCGLWVVRFVLCFICVELTRVCCSDGKQARQGYRKHDKGATQDCLLALSGASSTLSLLPSFLPV